MLKIKKIFQKCGKLGGKGEKVRKFNNSFSTLVWKNGLRFVYGQNWKKNVPKKGNGGKILLWVELFST